MMTRCIRLKIVSIGNGEDKPGVGLYIDHWERGNLLMLSKQLAQTIRKKSLLLTSQAETAHIGSVFSCADILAVLYSGILKQRPDFPKWAERDRFILSKGHAAAGLYVALAELGYISSSLLDSFCQNGSPLFGHASHVGITGVEISTGSLGHGLSIACGMAYALKQNDHIPAKVVVLLSDGECNVGTVWEAALFAGHHKLNNLIVVIDHNGLQSLGETREILNLDPLDLKWKSFQWRTELVDGHNHAELTNVFERAYHETQSPTCIIANTIKGKGVSFMENKVLWHYRTAKGQELADALSELEESSENSLH